MPTFPTRFHGLVTRSVLAEMLAHTYAEARNIDPNEAYTRLDQALRDLKLIEGVQRAIWNALRDAKPGLDDTALVEHVAKRLEKPRRFRAFKPKRADLGATTALTVMIDIGASVSSGEAADLLHSAEGQRLLERGFMLIGEHLAREMLR